MGKMHAGKRNRNERADSLSLSCNRMTTASICANLLALAFSAAALCFPAMSVPRAFKKRKNAYHRQSRYRRLQIQSQSPCQSLQLRRSIPSRRWWQLPWWTTMLWIGGQEMDIWCERVGIGVSIKYHDERSAYHPRYAEWRKTYSDRNGFLFLVVLIVFRLGVVIGRVKVVIEVFNFWVVFRVGFGSMTPSRIRYCHTGILSHAFVIICFPIQSTNWSKISIAIFVFALPTIRYSRLGTSSQAFVIIRLSVPSTNWW